VAASRIRTALIVNPATAIRSPRVPYDSCLGGGGEVGLAFELGRSQMAGEPPTGSEADQGKNAKPDAFLAAGPVIIAFKTETNPTRTNGRRWRWTSPNGVAGAVPRAGW